MKKYPKIGIRPTIDGRQGGVRESLEDKTMNLAKAVAELISSNLKNGDGSPVECVIADSTIGRVAESAACAEKFEREGVGATITVTSCWCYGSETMDMHPHWPKAVWGFNGTERPGAVYLAAVLAGHAQKGLPAFGIYGHDVQDLDDNTIPADVAEKLLRFARAAFFHIDLALVDGILMRAGECGKHQLAGIRLAGRHLHLGAALIHFLDFIDVVEIQLRILSLSKRTACLPSWRVRKFMRRRLS